MRKGYNTKGSGETGMSKALRRNISDLDEKWLLLVGIVKRHFGLDLSESIARGILRLGYFKIENIVCNRPNLTEVWSELEVLDIIVVPSEYGSFIHTLHFAQL